jgi:hypothetical protein
LAQLPAQSTIDEHFLRNHCGNTVAGVDQLCQWLQSNAD